MSTLSAILPAVALALLVFRAVSASRDPEGPGLRPGTKGWLCVPCAALAAVAAWCLLGLYQVGLVELVVFCLAALLSGHAIVHRDRLRERLLGAARSKGVPAPVLLALLVLACAVLGFLALELPYNWEILSMRPQFAALEAGLILLALVTLLFLAQRRAQALAVGVGACFVMGLAQHFVASFKTSAILPNDLFVLGTAAAVSGGYVYSVSGLVLLGLSCVLLACALCSLARPPRTASARARALGVAGNLAVALASALALGAAVTVPSYFDDLGVEMEYWYSIDYYRRQGFLTTFVAVAQDLPIDEPEGYSEGGARELEASYARAYDEGVGSSEGRRAAEAQFSEERPSIVCVMNESFSDLSVLDGDAWGYEGLGYAGDVEGALLEGELSVSVIGGGTCNSEFEFLTGVPLAYVGDGKYPYSLYDLSDAPSLVAQLSELGYGTTAIHPNYASNWNRDRVYEALGFDEFLTIEDFEGAQTYHSGVSDAATYDKVLEVLESSDEPQFVFDVTMQNHSGFDQNNIGGVEQYHVDGMSDYDNARLSEYLACIDESERALEDFMGELAELDRPVVVLFFGDHEPELANIVNDAVFAGETDELAHNLRTHETVYYVWANYDVAGAGEKNVGSGGSAEPDPGAGAPEPAGEPASPSFLAGMMLDAVGAPLTDFQKAQLAVREEMPALSLVGTLRADGTWVAADDADAQPEAYDDLAKISYLEFASKLE